MDGHIRTTPAADRVIRTRSELARLLDSNGDFIAGVVADPGKFYTAFPVPKPNGELRMIRPPRRSLRHLQRTLLQELYRRVRVRSCLHGGIRGRSIVTHATSHVGRHMVATLDIRKFFPSTTAAHLIPVLTALGFVEDALCDVLALVLLDGQLPQGAPTSSLLANLAFAPGDTNFIELCLPRKLRYSRYVDDIAISGAGDFHHLRGRFETAITSAGYAVAAEKIHFMPHHVRQVVTGLVVNEKLRPTQQFIADLKGEIRLCIEHGARLIALGQGLTVRQLKNRLTGRVAHVCHIDPALGRQFRGMLCGVEWRSTVRVA
jgi:RNA-directed DNA polymerase